MEIADVYRLEGAYLLDILIRLLAQHIHDVVVCDNSPQPSRAVHNRYDVKVVFLTDTGDLLLIHIDVDADHLGSHQLSHLGRWGREDQILDVQIPDQDAVSIGDVRVSDGLLLIGHPPKVLYRLLSGHGLFKLRVLGGHQPACGIGLELYQLDHVLPLLLLQKRQELGEHIAGQFSHQVSPVIGRHLIQQFRLPDAVQLP